MGVATSFTRIPAADFGPAQARHLLMRVGLGATPARVNEAVEAGLDATVDRLLTGEGAPVVELPDPPVDPDVRRPPTDEERMLQRQAYREQNADALEQLRQERQRRNAEDRRMFRQLQLWWLERMIVTPRPAEENMTLLWHSHFATSYRQVNDAYLMWQQNEGLRRLSINSFARLVRYIVHDPAMLKYLNNDRNNRQQPNENLARELMELFTLGVGHYTEQDIREGARALTGYHVDDNDFTFRERLHDPGKKTILGVTGEIDGDDFVSILLRRSECLGFIAFKIYRHLVADVGDDPKQWQPHERAAIEQVAHELRRNEYRLEPTLRTLLMSHHFFDPGIVGQKIKSPTQLVVGTCRSLDLPARSRRRITDAMSLMGQELFAPPSVAGWDIGRAWINTSTLFVRQNTATYLVTGQDPQEGRRDRQRNNGNRYDPMPLLAGVDRANPTAVVDHFVDHLLGAHTPAGRRAPLVAAVKERTGGQPIDAEATITLLTLITAMPEYQLC